MTKRIITPVCFWCNKPKNHTEVIQVEDEIIEDFEQVIINYIPCEECEAKMNKGITFFGIDLEEGRLTGTCLTLLEDSELIDDILSNQSEESKNAIITNKKGIMEEEALRELISTLKEEENNNESNNN